MRECLYENQHGEAARPAERTDGKKRQLDHASTLPGHARVPIRGSGARSGEQSDTGGVDRHPLSPGESSRFSRRPLWSVYSSYGAVAYRPTARSEELLRRPVVKRKTGALRKA